MLANAQRMKSGSFSNTTTLTSTNSFGFSNGNNLRFNDCTILGPIASDVPTAYTHFANSLEFTGATLFDKKVRAFDKDTGALLTRAFTQKTPDGAVRRGLDEMKAFLRPFFD